jgi:hypothetical protein
MMGVMRNEMKKHNGSKMGFIRFIIEVLYNLYLFCIRYEHKLKFNFHAVKPIPKRRLTMFNVSCTTEEKVLVTLAPTTEAGALVLPVNGVTVTVVSGDGSFEIVDNSSFYLISGALVGDTQYTVSAEFDPDGDGLTESLADTIVLTVGQAQIKSFGFQVAEPVLK